MPTQGREHSAYAHKLSPKASYSRRPTYYHRHRTDNKHNADNVENRQRFAEHEYAYHNSRYRLKGPENSGGRGPDILYGSRSA